LTTLDGTAPVISDVIVTNITNNSVTITWNTDESSNSQVDYGLTAAYGSQVVDGTMVSSHSITLSGLTDGATYHYRVKSNDTAGNSAFGMDATFTLAVLRRRGGQLTSQD
jgi:chitodextrinase